MSHGNVKNSIVSNRCYQRSVTVHFSGDMIIQSNKDQFLNNKENKQQFLVYLSDKLERAGCITDHAKHDADVLIVQTAIVSARAKD